MDNFPNFSQSITLSLSSGEVPATVDVSTLIEILGLVCDATYEVSVAAKTAGGLGPEATFTFKTDGTPGML